MIRRWQSMGIRKRTVIIAVVPVLLMFLSFVTYVSYSRYLEGQVELEERGALIATALAFNSEYGVISGNRDDVARTVHGVVSTDPEIIRIVVFDQRGEFFSVEGRASASGKSRSFEHPIARQLIAVDPFSLGDTLHLTSAESGPSDAARSEIVGKVQVTMAVASVLERQRWRIFVGAGIAGVALLVATLLGLVLAASMTRPLSKFSASVKRIRGGNYAVDIDGGVSGELGELQAAIVEMARGLHEMHQDMEGKVRERTIELLQARDEAVRLNDERRRLIQRVTDAIEEERKDIAREIHDELNAGLIAGRLEAQRIRELATRDVTSNTIGQIYQSAESLIALIRDQYAMGRNLVRRLRPEVIDTLGMRAAIEEIVRTYDNIHATCSFDFEATGSFEDIPSEIGLVAYRFVQEALANVVKHAKAHVCHVRLGFSDVPSIISISIEDDGVGFDAATTERGIGLIGMRERAEAAQGKLEISSALGRGTRLVVDIPVPHMRPN